jgi:hypothetical protein
MVDATYMRIVYWFCNAKKPYYVIEVGRDVLSSLLACFGVVGLRPRPT